MQQNKKPAPPTTIFCVSYTIRKYATLFAFYVQGKSYISRDLVKQTGNIVVNRNTQNTIIKAHTHISSKIWFRLSHQKKGQTIMPVFRVKKVKDYTIMQIFIYATASYLYGQKDCCVKCSQCPPEWNFTLQGLVYSLFFPKVKWGLQQKTYHGKTNTG